MLHRQSTILETECLQTPSSAHLLSAGSSGSCSLADAPASATLLFPDVPVMNVSFVLPFPEDNIGKHSGSEQYHLSSNDETALLRKILQKQALQTDTQVNAKALAATLTQAAEPSSRTGCVSSRPIAEVPASAPLRRALTLSPDKTDALRSALSRSLSASSLPGSPLNIGRQHNSPDTQNIVQTPEASSPPVDSGLQDDPFPLEEWKWTVEDWWSIYKTMVADMEIEVDDPTLAVVAWNTFVQVQIEKVAVCKSSMAHGVQT